MSVRKCLFALIIGSFLTLIPIAVAAAGAHEHSPVSAFGGFEWGSNVQATKPPSN